MKKLLCITIITCIVGATPAQITNLSSISPAGLYGYENMSFYSSYTDKFSGFENSQKIMDIAGVFPITEKINLGTTITYQQYGIHSHTRAELQYAYRLQLSKDNYLDFGFSAGITNLSSDYKRLLDEQGDENLHEVINQYQPTTTLANKIGITAKLGQVWQIGAVGDFLEQSYGGYINMKLIRQTNQTVWYEEEQKSSYIQIRILSLWNVRQPLLNKTSAIISYETDVFSIGVSGAYPFATSAFAGIKLKNIFVGYCYSIPLMNNFSLNTITPSHQLSLQYTLKSNNNETIWK